MMKQFDEKVLEQREWLMNMARLIWKRPARVVRIVSGAKRLSPTATALCGRKRWEMTCKTRQPASEIAGIFLY